MTQRVTQSESALASAKLAAQAATVNKVETERIANDMQTVSWVAKFYRDKLEAASAKALFDGGIEKSHNRQVWINSLRESVNDFRQLTELTKSTYESMSDVPAWYPTQKLPCPYHWSDLLPIYERELAEQEMLGDKP